MRILLKQNECLIVGFEDCEDEVFTIEYNNIIGQKNASEIKITTNFADTSGREGIIYHEISCIDNDDKITKVEDSVS